MKNTDIMQEKINEFLSSQIGKEFYGVPLELDSQVGTVFLSVPGKSIYCTPFWEDTKGIPIDITDWDGDGDDTYVVVYPYPRTDEQFENFKTFYLDKLHQLAAKHK